MRRFLVGALALAFSLSGAHLTPGSFKFSRTGPYHPDDTLTVSFAVDVPHGACNVDLRLDGKKWTSLKTGIAAGSRQTYSYKWKVGPDTTSRGKIRICQLNGTTCTDADSTDDPSGAKNGARYVLISPVFTIAPAASPLAPKAADGDLSLVSARPGSVELAFALASEGRVVLAAYDARGREAAVLLNARYPAGSQRLSLFSEALRAHPDWILRLDAGGRIRSLHP